MIKKPIMRKRFPILATLLLAPLAALHGADVPAKRPNILLILADDLGYGDVGCYGATKVKTPNIDRLAREGRTFTDAHSASAVCTPSRYALLTGEYPFRKSLWGPVMNPSPLVVDTSRTTVASLLKRQGYSTAIIGKWHLGFGSQPKPDWNTDLKPGPLELGFDHFFGIPVVNSHPPFVWVQDRRVVGLDPADPLVYGGQAVTQPFQEKAMSPPMSGAKAAHALYREEEHGTTLTEKATAWLRSRKDEPFFLYFSTPHIHHPFTPGAKFKGSSGAGRYGDFIQEFDWMVGEVMRTLDELKLRDNTLVILTSDNGGMLNQGGQEAVKAGHRLNGDLLGFKFDAWEGGHRVPFIARWPGKIPAGSVSDQLICQVDFLATFAALTGAKLAPAEARDSLNILSALTGTPAKPVRNELVISPHRSTHLALREGSWLYIGARGGGGFTAGKPGSHALGGPAALEFAGEVNSDVEDGKFKPGAPDAQLYNLAADPSQARNVIREQPEAAARMKARLEALLADAPAPPAAASSSPDKRPNIVLVFADDLGWKNVGYQGSDFMETPNIDRLAKEGMVFTAGYAGAGNCAPSRACLLSGTYTPRHGVYAVGSTDRGPKVSQRLIPIPNGRGLAKENITVADALKAAGYVTGIFGKWHLDGTPDEQGFDTVFQSEHGWGKREADNPKAIYSLTQAAGEFMEKNKDRPFFVYLPHYAIHTGLQARESTLAKFKAKKPGAQHDNALYAACTYDLDDGIGILLKKLADLGLEKNTLVVFTSDNGGTQESSQEPLRGNKGCYYEGGIREPFIVRWPGLTKPGSHCDVPVINVDLFPTFLAAAGAPVPTGKTLDGESLIPLLNGEGTLKRASIFWHFPGYLDNPVIRGRELDVRTGFRSRPVTVIRKGDWKLHLFHEEWQLDGGRAKLAENHAVELYNLKEDIGERNNLANKEIAKRDELLDDLLAWQKSVNARVPDQPSPRYNPQATSKGKGKRI